MTSPNVSPFIRNIELTDDDLFEVRVALQCRVLQCERIAAQRYNDGETIIADAWEGRAVALASIIERLTA